ncbi:hypothetical protein IJ541_06470 [bacterium]|nr:hypothetical protein [bacterium]
MKYKLLSKLFSWIFPTKEKRAHFRVWCEEIDNRSNIVKIKNNYNNILAGIAEYPQAKPIKVLFLVSDIAKWKAQSLFDLMKQSGDYEPVIALTLVDFQLKLSKAEQRDILNKGLQYFKTRSMDCVCAYDVEEHKASDLREFNPILVFYDQPWKISKNQMPCEVSKYALTFYIPYYVQTYGDNYMECKQELHQSVYRYYILNKEWEEFYAPEFEHAAGKIVGLGHTMLDEYYLKRDKIQDESKYVIYAPHHSFGNWENFGTFDKNGKEILEYAKQHKELNWVFKPHPTLKYRAVKSGVMTQTEIDEYYKEWESFAKVCYDSDYIKYFLNSKALITDSASFLIEYFCTGKPIIHLISRRSKVVPKPAFEKIINTFYKAYNNDEMFDLFDKILIKNDDEMKENRLKVLSESGLAAAYAGENILKDVSGIMNINKREFEIDENT